MKHTRTKIAAGASAALALSAVLLAGGNAWGYGRAETLSGNHMTVTDPDRIGGAALSRDQAITTADLVKLNSQEFENTIQNNSASSDVISVWGGAMYASGDVTLDMERLPLSFEGNYAHTDANGRTADGGAIYSKG